MTQNLDQVNDTMDFEIGSFWQHRRERQFVFISGIDHVAGVITITDTKRFASVTILPRQLRGIYDEAEDCPGLTADELAVITDFLEYRAKEVEPVSASKHFRPVGVKQFHNRKANRNNFGRIKDAWTQ